jgi:hypothetical protein
VRSRGVRDAALDGGPVRVRGRLGFDDRPPPVKVADRGSGEDGVRLWSNARVVMGRAAAG